MPTVSLRCVHARTGIAFILCILAAALGGCGIFSPQLQVATESRTLAADDGFQLHVYRNFAWILGRAMHDKPRGVVYYIQGSDDRSVLSATERLAGACAMGFDVVMLERRGVTADGLTDPAAARQFCTKQRRVADTMGVIDFDQQTRAPGMPAILVGTSEGGDVAAAVCAREPRITHVILIGSGGGMTQADEMRLMLDRLPPSLGIRTHKQLDTAFDDIRAHPDADKDWFGHPYRRWASYAFERPVDDLAKFNGPVLIIHGDADESVPVQSARLASQALMNADWPASTPGAISTPGKRSLRYLELAGVDHHLREVKSGASAFPRVEIGLVTWLRDTGVLSDEERERFTARVRAAHPEMTER